MVVSKWSLRLQSLAVVGVDRVSLWCKDKTSYPSYTFMHTNTHNYTRTHSHTHTHTHTHTNTHTHIHTHTEGPVFLLWARTAGLLRIRWHGQALAKTSSGSGHSHPELAPGWSWLQPANTTRFSANIIKSEMLLKITFCMYVACEWTTVINVAQLDNVYCMCQI